MSTISKKLSGFIFNGPSLALGTAAFKSSLNSVIGFNAAGTGYITYNPANAFNSLTQLVQDGVYIVDAKTTGFDIPGATLVAASGASPGPLALVNPDFRFSNTGSTLEFGITNSTYPYTRFIAVFDDILDGSSISGTANDDAVQLFPGVLAPGSAHHLTIVDFEHNVLRYDFVVPAR